MTETAPKPDSIFMLKAVRIAFPVLFVAEQFQGEGGFSYSATFLIEPGSANDKTVRDAIAQAAKKWEKKTDEVMKAIQGQSMKFCYIDGNTKAYDGYAGKWALAAKRPQDSGKPKVLDKNKDVELTAEDGRIYGGCYVNAKCQIWAQVKGKGAPGMRCSLIAVQFYSDGESFGGAPPADGSGFESVESADDANEFA